MKIVSAADLAAENRLSGTRELIHRLAQASRRPWNGRINHHAPPVMACIDRSRWIAHCECGGAEYVDPDDPIFYCCSCGNGSYQGEARPVIFPHPEMIEEIISALMEREEEEDPSLPVHQRKMLAKPALPMLIRSWQPGETPEALREETAAMKRLYQPKKKTKKKKKEEVE